MANHPSALSAKQQAELTMLITSRKWSATKLLLKKISAQGSSTSETNTNGKGEASSKATVGLYLLHLALRSMAPLSIVTILLDATAVGHPLSITTPESSTGMLPLHLACRYGAPPSVVNLILMHHPSAVDVRDGADRTAVDYAKGPTYPQQSGTGQVEVVAVLDRAEGYQAIATMIQRRAGAEMEHRLGVLEAKHTREMTNKLDEAKRQHEAETDELREEMQRKEKENARLQQKLELLRRGLELERSDRARHDDETKSRQASADGSMANLLGQLRQELYATRKWAVVMELEAMAAKSSANNMERRLSYAEEDLTALREANRPFSSIFSSPKEDTAAVRIHELEDIIDTKDEEGVRLARRVAKLEGMVQTANDTIENLERQNDLAQGRIAELKDGREGNRSTASGSHASRGRSRVAKSLESRDTNDVVQTGDDEEDGHNAAPFNALEDMQTALKRALSGGEELLSTDVSKAKDTLSTSNVASPMSATSIASLFSVCL